MKRLAILLILAGALVAPSAAFASGVVLKVQRATHLVAVTRANNKVALVHTSAAARLKVGQRVRMTARTLRNGTLAASAVHVVGHAQKVRFRGLMLKASKARFLISANGAVLEVNRDAKEDDDDVDVGDAVVVTVDVDDDDEALDEDTMAPIDADHPGGAIEGRLTLGTGKITVVSEHMALVLNVPTGFDLTGFANGDEVLAKFTQGADGLLTLTSLSGDEDEQEADDDDGGHDGGHDGHGHHGGGGGGGGGDDDDE
jgi:hypothetical protein